MYFWSPDFANLTKTEKREFVFPEQPQELIDAIRNASDKERKRRGLSALIDDGFEVEVRPDVDSLGVFSHTETPGRALCYNLDIPDFQAYLDTHGLAAQVMPIVHDLLKMAEPYMEGRSAELET